MNQNATNDIWLKKFCSGEESAYQVFFDEYYQILAHFAMKYLQDTEASEDVVHDVILDIYSNKRVFDNLNNLKSFLYLSVKNRCLNYLEHRKARTNYLNDISITQKEEFFLDSIIEEEIYFLMHKAIKELPDQIQSIYELSLKGKSNEEIAQMLDLSLDSVKSYKKRGKQMLKEKLKDLMCFLSVTL